jgi:LuxR family quorum-sensing system transcriptional regulator CciR
MGSTLEGFVDDLSSASSKQNVWEAMRKFAENIGFSDCSMVTGSTENSRIVNPRTITSYSREFRLSYENEGLGEYDPFLHFHCHDMKMKRIVSKDLSTFPKASPMHRLFLDHVMANGAAGGVGIPFRTFDQAVFGGWILSCPEPDTKVDMLVEDHGEIVQLATILAYERMCAFGLDRIEGGILSARERECLRWLCSGLRVTAIADKLDIGESAVNLYVSNAKRKLGARTREQAIARALLNGEIQL